MRPLEEEPDREDASGRSRVNPENAGKPDDEQGHDARKMHLGSPNSPAAVQVLRCCKERSGLQKALRLEVVMVQKCFTGRVSKN